MSFPGGIEDPKDLNNPVLVALRETSEELNVTADAFSVIGVFHQAETSSQIQGFDFQSEFVWVLPESLM